MECYSSFLSPVGELYMIANEKGITSVSWHRIPQHAVRKEVPLIVEARLQLEAYFRGERKDFDLALDPVGTVFQKQVWEVLKMIPYGKTWTYRQVAEAVGNEKACRAVGMANHCNPISIIVPCHRVIGADGKLTGYAGGLDTKAYLLNLEKCVSGE